MTPSLRCGYVLVGTIELSGAGDCLSPSRRYEVLDGMKPPNSQKPDSVFALLRNHILVAFGVVGLAITCLQGLTPFIELTQLVSWIVSNWTDWSRALWIYVFAYFSIDISKITADLLSGAFYLASFIIAFRRRRGIIYSNTSAIFKFVKTKKGMYARMWGVALDIPMVAMLYFLYLNSPYLGVSFAGIYLLILASVFIIGTRRFMKLDQFLFGKQVIFYSDWSAGGFFMTLMSWYVVLLASIVFILNEIGLNGANILTFMEWARCEAGITC